jgi:hypothetical protein
MAGVISKPIPVAGYYEPAPIVKPSFPGEALTDIEVACRLNVAPEWLVANREKLQAMGFPEPVAGAPERWDAFAVYQWHVAMTRMGRSFPPAWSWAR